MATQYHTVGRIVRKLRQAEVKLSQGRSTEEVCGSQRARWRNHVWPYDFVAGQTHDGRGLRLPVVVDEYTR